MVKNRRPGRSKRTSARIGGRISSSIARRSGKTIARKPEHRKLSRWNTFCVVHLVDDESGDEGGGSGVWGGGRGCQGAARAGWTGRERSGVGGRGGSARGRLCTSPRSGGGRDLNARADGKKRPAEGWRRRGVRADGRTRTRARGGGSGRAARPRRPRRPRTRRRAPRTSGPARRRRRASRVRRTLRGGGERRVRPRALLFFHGLARRRARRGRAW